MNQIQISLANEPRNNIELLITTLNDKLKIKNIVLLEGKTNSLISIRCQEMEVPQLLEDLGKIGVGTKFGIIDILKLEVSIPNIEREDLSEGLSSRISIAEIEVNIKEAAELHTNYYVFIIVAALIAGAGLILNSTAIIIGAMIISPLMGPILGVSYGVIIKNYQLVKKGFIGQFSGILLAIGIGAVLAILALFVYDSPPLTNEMLSRSFPTIFDIIVSISAGIAVGFAITSKIQSSLVGVAIALSLMPPAVNIGVTLIYGNSFLSFGSFILLMCNILAINLSAIFIFKLKKIKVLKKKSVFWKGPQEKSRKSHFRKLRIRKKRKTAKSTKK